MENGLIKKGEVELTPNGSLYIEKLSDTLHRVKKYRMKLIGGETKELTYEQYESIIGVLDSLNGSSRFIKFKDGEIISSSQITSIKPYEVIIDTRKEVL